MVAVSAFKRQRCDRRKLRLRHEARAGPAMRPGGGIMPRNLATHPRTGRAHLWPACRDHSCWLAGALDKRDLSVQRRFRSPEDRFGASLSLPDAPANVPSHSDFPMKAFMTSLRLVIRSRDHSSGRGRLDWRRRRPPGGQRAVDFVDRAAARFEADKQHSDQRQDISAGEVVPWPGSARRRSPRGS